MLFECKFVEYRTERSFHRGMVTGKKELDAWFAFLYSICKQASLHFCSVDMQLNAMKSQQKEKRNFLDILVKYSFCVRFPLGSGTCLTNCTMLPEIERTQTRRVGLNPIISGSSRRYAYRTDMILCAVLRHVCGSYIVTHIFVASWWNSRPHRLTPIIPGCRAYFRSLFRLSHIPPYAYLIHPPRIRQLHNWVHGIAAFISSVHQSDVLVLVAAVVSVSVFAFYFQSIYCAATHGALFFERSCLRNIQTFRTE